MLVQLQTVILQAQFFHIKNITMIMMFRCNHTLFYLLYFGLLVGCGFLCSLTVPSSMLGLALSTETPVVTSSFSPEHRNQKCVFIYTRPCNPAKHKEMSAKNKKNNRFIKF